MLSLVLQSWQAFLAVAGFLFFWLWETRSPFFGCPGRVRHAAVNVTVTLVNGVIVAVGFAAAAIAAANWAAAEGYGLLYLLPLPDAARAAAAFVLFDMWTYAWHRLNHRIGFLWRFHRMHHSDPNMDVSTAARFHPGEIIISSVLQLGLIVAVGIPAEVLGVYSIVLLASTQFHHSDMALPGGMDRAVRWVIVSPYMHKVHHSQLREETDSNYSSILSVWDRLFGSYRESSDYQQIRFGLPDFADAGSRTLKGLLLTPLRPSGTLRK